MTPAQKLLMRKKLKEQRESGEATAEQFLILVDILETTSTWGAFEPEGNE